MPAPVVDTNIGLTVGQGKRAVITSTQLDTSDPTSSSYYIAVTTLPTKGTLRRCGVPLTLTSLGTTNKFTQADIDAGYITYESDGLNGVVADGFTFYLHQELASPTHSASGDFVLTINAPNNGFLLRLIPDGAVASFLRFSREQQALAYIATYKETRPCEGDPTTFITMIPTIDTDWNFLDLNQNNVNYHILDDDYFADTAKVKTTAIMIQGQLPTKDVVLTHLLHEYGDGLEEEYAHYLDGLTTTQSRQWAELRLLVSDNVGGKYHNIRMVWRMVRALIQ